jgi:hypothetical protein
MVAMSRAGLLARGSDGALASSHGLSAFPGLYHPSGIAKDRSPLTVAGPRRIHTGFPISRSREGPAPAIHIQLFKT